MSSGAQHSAEAVTDFYFYNFLYYRLGIILEDKNHGDEGVRNLSSGIIQGCVLLIFVWILEYIRPNEIRTSPTSAEPYVADGKRRKRIRVVGSSLPQAPNGKPSDGSVGCLVVHGHGATKTYAVKTTGGWTAASSHLMRVR